MKALVTGASGFVGGRMIAALADRGYDLRCIDIRQPIQPVDARDFFRRSTERFDLVVHLAAVVGGRATIEGDPLAVAVDLAIDAELFQWAARTKQPHILYFSSSAAYPVALQRGEPSQASYPGPRLLDERSIDLDNIRQPDQTYGLAKLVGEIQAREARKHGVKVTIARPFSGTGPTQTLDYPVPAIVDRAVRQEEPLSVWSDSVRDIIHIDDVVDIALTAVDLGIEQPFNCGTGIATSFGNLARMAADVVGYPSRAGFQKPLIVIETRMPAGVAYRVADPSFMRSWYRKPLRTVEDIVAEMVAARSQSLASSGATS